MPINLIRVINEQTVNRSILLDKLDDGQANTEGYASLPKQQVYVPFFNPKNPSVKGYVDLIPSSRVLLSADRGTIKGLHDEGRVNTFVFDSGLTAAPVITSVSNLGTDTTINGTTFLSVIPDRTYVKFTNAAGVSQIVSSASFSFFNATQIVVPDGVIVIGVPTESWTVTVMANVKSSNIMPIGNVPVITTAILDAPAAGDITLTGIDFLSTAPLTSSVVFTGVGAVTLTQAQITAGGGVFTDTSVVIPAALVPGVTESTTSASVIAEGFASAVVALIVRPVITSATIDAPGVGDLTLVGTSFLSNVGDSVVAVTGDGAVTLTETDILAAGGVAVFTEVSIIIPAALIPGVVAITSSVTVTADGLNSVIEPVA